MNRPLLYTLLFLAACGGDDSSSGDDVDAGGGACADLGTPSGTIASFPGDVSGTVLGEGADLTVAEGTCTVDNYFEPVGEDTVIALEGLTTGQLYAAVLEADDDLGFYVLSSCEVAGGSVTGGCDLFEDGTLGGEQHTFTASAESQLVVIDTGSDSADLTTGDFTLRVFEAECETSDDCSGGTPNCVGFVCVECATDFDCTAATPSCDLTTNECVAGFDMCTGDDGGDTTAPGDDGPTVATALTLPTVGVATVVTAAVCSLPSTEADWYTFTVAGADVTYGFALTWASATADLDLYVLDDTGAIVAAGENFDQAPEGFLAELGAGTYYVMARQYAPADAAAAAAYTLTFSVPECLDNFECVGQAGEPVCSGSGVCGVGPAECTNDDAGDTATGGDDGPGGARDLGGAVDTAVPLPGRICNTGDGETDFYKVDLSASGSGLDLSLEWTDATKDLDLFVMDDEGTIYGASFWKKPENVVLTHLAGQHTYFIRVDLVSGDDIVDASMVEYTITATRRAAVSCGTPGLGAASCALTHATQVYRGECLASGACESITTTGGANNAPCDTGEDCTSGTCSYILFEKDAEKSVCTTDCASNADCATLTGTTCTTGFGANLCVPACADDLSCGADINSSTIDTDQPWDYLTCTTPGSSGVCSP